MDGLFELLHLEFEAVIILAKPLVLLAQRHVPITHANQQGHDDAHDDQSCQLLPDAKVDLHLITSRLAYVWGGTYRSRKPYAAPFTWQSH